MTPSGLRRVLSRALGTPPSSGDPNRRAKTVVSVTFDDGWANQYRTHELFAAHGMRATFYVNSATIGADGILTWAQLEALQAEGHEIGGHGLDHLDLTSLTVREARRQVADDREHLLAHGFDAKSFAYPYGAYDADVTAVVQESGYAAGRAAWGLRNIVAKRDRRPCAGALSPLDPYAIPTACCIHSTTPLEALERYITRAERSGGWVPLVLHRVCEGCGDEPAASTSLDTLAGLLEWLHRRAAHGTAVRTVSEVITGTGAVRRITQR